MKILQNFWLALVLVVKISETKLVDFFIKVFRTIVFIFIVISTTFWSIGPPAFFVCFSKSGTFMELRILADLIGNWGYYKVKNDPTMETERKLSQILCKNKDLIPQTKYRQLIQHYSKLPHIYDLPKIHKNDIPLRPIVSNRGSACPPLNHFLVEIISPLTVKSSSYVKNSAHFVERISDAPHSF